MYIYDNLYSRTFPEYNKMVSAISIHMIRKLEKYYEWMW